MNDINELRNLNLNELHAELLSLRKEQFNLRMKKANGTLDKTHLVRKVRKEIARVKTIMNEKASDSHV